MEDLEYYDHPLDTPYEEVRPSSSTTSIVVLVLMALVSIGLYLGIRAENMYIKPPSVYFAQVGIPRQQTTFPQGMRLVCIHYDGSTNIIRPNWEEPKCTATLAKKKGWY